MISIDQVLLGLTVVAFLVAVPIGIALTGLLLWTTSKSKSGRRSAA